MKKVLFVVLVALGLLGVANAGNEYKNCLISCKAKKGGSAVADFECPNIECKHLNPNRKDIDDIKGDFTGNHATGSGGAVSVPNN